MIRMSLICTIVLAPLAWTDAAFSDELTAVATNKAVQRYLAEIEEIDRVAKLRKAEARKRLEQALKPIEQFQTNKSPRYRGMLGSYFNSKGRIPFVLLSAPTGTNVFGEYARSVFNGRYDESKGLYSFQTRGHVVIPKDGTYYLEASRGHWSVKLNGLAYSLGAKVYGELPSADVKLDQGVYDVFFSIGNNGGQLPGATIRISDKKTKKELPIFVYESEVKDFLDDLSMGVELMETSKWTLKENKLE